MPEKSSPTLRQLYDLWVEDQIEDYKDSVSRSDLLRLADEACEDLRVSQAGQYQITEILLTNAVDRKIFSLLQLPSFRAWSRAHRNGGRPGRPTEAQPSGESEDPVGEEQVNPPPATPNDAENVSE